METTRMDEVSTTEGDEAVAESVDVPGTEASRSRWRRPWVWVAAVVVVLVIAAVVALIWNAVSNENQAETGASFNTAAVQRTDIEVTEQLSGTLGYGDADALTFVSSDDGVDTVAGALSGTVTAIAGEGTVVEPGDVLYEVNGEPVVVLRGSTPAYRSFSARMSDGADVAQLEQAMVDLGYATTEDLTVDEDFTSATAGAIERLQADLGADEDGVLQLGEVVFAPDPFLVAEVMVELGGTVGPGTPIVATSKALSGTVTTIADEGSIAGPGSVLLTIDAEPVVLLIGEVPAYRALKLGVVGDDVLQLEQALADLGYGNDEDFSVDGVFDEATRNTVLAWQRDIGAAPDGVVNVGDVVFAPAQVRIGEHLVAVGDQVRDGTPIMSTSVNETFVAVQLSTDDQDLVAVGDAVTVVLPDGTREPAVVSDIGTVVQASQSGDTYFEMTVTLDDPEAAPGLDEAPVDVEVVGDSASNVLSVPVTALIALAEGGYAVEVIDDGGTTRLVGVDPGLFADGRVEVAGDGLSDGMKVVVP
jgi:membrane fusion protein, multidrug efflux system